MYVHLLRAVLSGASEHAVPLVAKRMSRDIMHGSLHLLSGKGRHCRAAHKHKTLKMSAPPGPEACWMKLSKA